MFAAANTAVGARAGAGLSAGNEREHSIGEAPLLPVAYPTSGSLPFPYPAGPYPQQAALMDALLEGIPRRETGGGTATPAASAGTQTQTQTQTQTRKTRILALESPTGTGKSLSLACASLAWLDHEERLYRDSGDPGGSAGGSVHQPTGGAATTPGAPIPCQETGIGWLDSWKPPRGEESEGAGERGGGERHRRLLRALEDLRNQLHPPSRSGQQQQQHEEDTAEQQHTRLRERRENTLRMALTKSRMEERKRARDRKRKRKRRSTAQPAPSLAYESDDGSGETKKNNNDGGSNRFRSKLEGLAEGSAEWLLHPEHAPSSSSSSSSSFVSRLLWSGGSDPEERAAQKPPQVVYAARTHSQLSQFVREIRKTVWGKTLRVVTLASRGQGLCGELRELTGRKHHHQSKPFHGNQGHSSSSSSSNRETRLMEACLDLRKSKKGCSHYPSDGSVATLALHGLAEGATDLEDLVVLGGATRTCAYYATRMALPHAQLVVVPYTTLCSSRSRASLGLELHSNTLVLVDEAHNLPAAIGHLTSAVLALGHCEGAGEQLTGYLAKHRDKLSAVHLRWLGQLKQLIRGLIAGMIGNTNKTKTKNAMAPQTVPEEHRDHPQQRLLLSSSQFLVSQKLEAINLFPILRYMEESRLSQKLLGFMPPRETPETTDGGGASSSPPQSSHVSPMSIVETFLEKLTYASDSDGKVVIDRGQRATNPNASPRSGGREACRYETEPHLRFCVLNPAVHASDELWTAPRAVALVGGTLQPLDVMMRELVPGTIAEHAARAQASWSDRGPDSKPTAAATINPYARKNRTTPPPRTTTTVTTTTTTPSTTTHIVATKHHHKNRNRESHHRLYRSEEFWAFTCGHVVDPSHVLLQSLTRVGGTQIDVRHKTRSMPSMTTAIGTALVRLCGSVPNGMVVFLPSYKYEAVLVEAWKRRGSSAGSGSSGVKHATIWDQLQNATTVVREPREASQVEATLTRYAQAATKSRKGALLLSVVGGKLSEGINFSDDLCRCVAVVGLPFADRSDPLLQEKLKLVGSNGSSSNSSNDINSQAARDYYRSLCLRAVNQSVGRAIRHAGDWATIVLMDTRYPNDEAIARGLPSWLTESTPSWRKDSGDLENLILRSESFFRGTLRF